MVAELGIVFTKFFEWLCIDRVNHRHIVVGCCILILLFVLPSLDIKVGVGAQSDLQFTNEATLRQFGDFKLDISIGLGIKVSYNHASMLAKEVNLFKHIPFFVYRIPNVDHLANQIGQESAYKASWSHLVGAQFPEEVFKLFLKWIETRLDQLVLETWRHLGEEWLHDECIVAGML